MLLLYVSCMKATVAQKQRGCPPDVADSHLVSTITVTKDIWNACESLFKSENVVCQFLWLDVLHGFILVAEQSGICTDLISRPEPPVVSNLYKRLIYILSALTDSRAVQKHAVLLPHPLILKKMVDSNLFLDSKYLLCSFRVSEKGYLLIRKRMAMFIIRLMWHRTDSTSIIQSALTYDFSMLCQLSSVVQDLCNMQEAELRRLLKEEHISGLFRI